MFYSDDLHDELDAVDKLTQAMTGPDGEGAISELLRKLRIARDNFKPLRWTTGELPWVSKPVSSPVQIELSSDTLRAEPGDVISVAADWQLEPRPRVLRSPPTVWICHDTTTTVSVRTESGDTRGSTIVPLFQGALGIGPALAVPATIACVIEGVATAISPGDLRTAARDLNTDLTNWHELHTRRLIRLADWQLERALALTAPGLDAHSLTPPADLFVRASVRRTRPRGKSQTAY